MTPEMHDEMLLGLERQQRAAEKAAGVAERVYRISLGQRRRGLGWVNPDGTAPPLPITDDDKCQQWLEAVQSVHAIRAQIADHERAYTGWSRFRLVISSDGLVHLDARCRSFRDTTRTVVIPALSGKEPEAAVEMLGHACCSVCIPSAGTGTSRVSSSLVNVLVKRGTVAFEKALARQREVSARRGIRSDTVSHPSGTIRS